MKEETKLQVFDGDNIIKEENKPYNEITTTDEIQNIFKKIRKKSKSSENNLIINDNNKIDESKGILTINDNKINTKNNLENYNYYQIIIIIISFILFYLSFEPITNYFFLFHFFIFPIEYLQYIFCLISCIITAIFISFIILRKISGYHLIYMLFIFLFVFFLNHYKYIGTSHFDKSFNIFYEYISLLIHCLCILFIIYFLLKYLYYKGCLKKNHILIKLFVSRWNASEKIKKTENEALLNDKKFNFVFSKNKLSNTNIYMNIFFILFIQIFFICLLKLKNKKLFSCENLDIGLNGTHILYKENNRCHIKKPDGYCYMDFFKNYFDLTPIKNANCSLRNPIKEKENFFINLKGINNDINYDTAKRFVFPFTHIDPKYFLKNQIDIENFGKLVNQDIYDMDDEKNKGKKKLEPEAILDFSENNIYQGKMGELKINLVFNKTLSEERKKLENSKSLYDNIFMIYLDATSRAHFQREFPKLSKLIKNFMSYDDTGLKKVDAYQFMKYNSFAPITQYNIIPMFYGNSYKSSEGVNHIKYFKENGYITGHEVDMCNKEQYDISYDTEDKREYIEWDHENIAYLCDGNYFEITSPYPSNKGAFDTKERCLYGHTVSHYMIEYAKQFWEKYMGNKKYFRMAFNYGHEKTGAVISKLDEPLYNFLFEFYDKGYFDNTAVFIVSDHGNQNIGIYNIINKNQFEYEKKMGTFFLLLSKNDNINKFKLNLQNNQQVFLTPYDVHDTMMHIIYGNGDINDLKKLFSVNDKGNSVLFEINENERYCDKYDDWKDIKFCICNE